MLLVLWSHCLALVRTNAEQCRLAVTMCIAVKWLVTLLSCYSKRFKEWSWKCVRVPVIPIPTYWNEQDKNKLIWTCLLCCIFYSFCAISQWTGILKEWPNEALCLNQSLNKSVYSIQCAPEWGIHSQLSQSGYHCKVTPPLGEHGWLASCPYTPLGRLFAGKSDRDNSLETVRLGYWYARKQTSSLQIWPQTVSSQEL